MDPTPPYNDILDDEALAPLKRNHACLQCKKRKVKCDATKPSCSPCLRSHAHAVRSAHRNGTSPPVLTCTYTEGDSPEPGPAEEGKSKKKKSIGGGSSSSTTAPHVGVKRHQVSQGKRDTPDEEKDALKARIAELEARLAGLTPPSSHSNVEPSLPITSINPYSTNDMPFSSTFPQLSSSTSSTSRQDGARVDPILEEIGTSYTIPIVGMSDTNTVPLPEPIGGFGGLDDFFIVPKDWPKGLPLPFLLEHLVETFFNYVPQTPRMLHRATLLARIKLPPSSPDFPFPGLLHAICASAATYTAWVNNLAPHLLEESVQRHLALGFDLDTIEDFGLAQAHLGSKAVDLTTSICIMGSGPLIFQLAQTCILLGDVYFQKGFPMKGWMIGGQPSRLLSVLELCNRQPRTNTYKEPLLAPPETDKEREERLITTWMAFVVDAGFTMNSNWAPSMSLSETRCNFPTSAQEWNKLDGMIKNPQHASSLDLYYSHPIEDSFVFVAKGSTLMSQVGLWLRNWQQREKIPDDELTGSSMDSFKLLNHSIEAFSTSLPASLKNICRHLDTQTQTMSFDANLLSIHLIPNIAVCLLHEPFIQWVPYDPSTMVVQRAYDTIMAVLHLIPSNLDITLVLTPFLALSLYTVGRFISEFIKHAESAGHAQTALRYRADLTTLINIFERYGQRHPLGNAMVHFLENYMQASANNQPLPTDQCRFNGKKIEKIEYLNTNSPDENIETIYNNKLNLHAEISSNLPGAIVDGKMQFGVGFENTSVGRSNSTTSGISPNTMMSGMSNQPTPESIGSMNFSNCGSGSGSGPGENMNGGCSLDFDISGSASASGSGSGSVSGTGNIQQQQQQQHNGISISDLTNSTSNSTSNWTQNAGNGAGEKENFTNWDKSFRARPQLQPGAQLPMMTFLGNLGTEDTIQPLPIPVPLGGDSGAYVDWKDGPFRIPGMKD
ncbi:hypothetical protein I302_104518 [Kwoniella bestiolae CBS 10118]|uniref:Zn(2)-C6 fungal-type domain-containing protein n=1 Tax=Kwoniella bestiolae CBS 10118 TaxID=1296100 RepID=A0A1B9GBG5_9TREE|nr:hypothetical protein I302_03224 [Kwoniella bestiolae CBS 10118]OCF28365.1 hypothetical protein I302_03224 [Kwoniella bestiolae CBS 10118]